MFGNISDNEMEMFDRFSQGAMSKDEQYQFTTLLSEDESLRNKFKLYQILISKVIEDSVTTELLKKRFVQVSKRSKVIQWIRLLVGSAAIIVLGFFTIKLLYNNKQDYSQYVFSDPGLPITMANSVGTDWSQFNESFAKRDYKEGLQALAELPETDTTVYYRGLCYELTDKTENAIQEYQKVIFNKHSLYRQKAVYRTAIIYLNKNDKVNAVGYLNQTIIDRNNPYRKQAEELLRLINGGK